jgi:hypothetical protein
LTNKNFTDLNKRRDLLKDADYIFNFYSIFNNDHSNSSLVNPRQGIRLGNTDLDDEYNFINFFKNSSKVSNVYFDFNQQREFYSERLTLLSSIDTNNNNNNIDHLNRNFSNNIMNSTSTSCFILPIRTLRAPTRCCILPIWKNKATDHLEVPNDCESFSVKIIETIIGNKLNNIKRNNFMKAYDLIYNILILRTFSSERRIKMDLLISLRKVLIRDNRDIFVNDAEL